MSLAVVHFNRGWQLHEQGDLAAAERSYRAALRSDPALVEPRINLSAIAAMLVERAAGPEHAAMLENAVACYRAALHLDADLEPQTPDSESVTHAYLRCRGRDYTELLVRLGRIDEAIGYVRSLAAAHDEEGWIAARLEQLLHLAGRCEEALIANDAAYRLARARLEDRLAGEPANAGARLALEQFLGRFRDLERARVVFTGYEDLSLRDRYFQLDMMLHQTRFRFQDGAEPGSLAAALARRRDRLARPAVLSRRKHLVAAMLVRDEIDLLADTVACHLNQGADLVIVTDNGSVDGSRDLLADLERSASVQVLDEPAHTHDQALWMTRMVHLARDQHGAEWVICADADEVWLAEDGDLRAAIARDAAFYGEETRLLLCQHSMMVPDRRQADSPGYRPTDARLALVDPLHWLPVNQPAEKHYYNGLFQAVVRTDGFVTLWHGNHFGAFDGLARYGYARSIHILHFHLRSREQLRRKQERTRRAMESNPDYEQVVAQGLTTSDGIFDAATYPTPMFEALRTAGRLIEIGGVPEIRDRMLPPRDQAYGEGEVLRREAADYFAALEPHLPRATAVR
jgi:tetratricopeptide (TPR) repeat protein